MVKTAIVHAQQMWEYMTLSRKTPSYLVNELNEIGAMGWELMSITYHKDPKGGGDGWLWTAFLKRPRVPPPPTAEQAGGQTAAEAAVLSAEQVAEQAAEHVADQAAAPPVDPTEKYRQGKVDVGDLTDEFEIHREGGAS